MKIICTTLLFFLLLATNWAQSTLTITDDDLLGGQTQTWTRNNIYLLDGFVYLEEGGVLNIEAGTVIKGKEVPSSGDNASALIISRGAQIFANGTVNTPIIFTAELDDVNDPNDLDPTDRGLWGGLIILGNGVIADDACVKGIEGIPAGESRALYGNCDNPNEEESSGVLRYVSIRHGGAALSEGNEINGLTLGGVGSGTTIEFIEIFSNLDDGIEYFGGTVNVKNAVISFCGDDGMDYDTGWRGKGQFWFVLVGDDTGDNGGEHDGAIPDENTPFSNPTIFNATYIGSPVAAKAMKLRDAAGGTYGNSIFTKFTNGIEVEEEPTKPIDSWERLQNGELNLLNNIWWDFAGGNTLAAGEIIAISSTATEDANGDVLRAHLMANENVVQDPGLGGISYTTDGGLNPIPNGTGPAYTTNLASYPNDEFFTPVSFKGAFCSEGVWINGWTALSATGVLNSTLASVDGMMCDQVVATQELIKGNKGYVLDQNRPNPFSSTTEFFFVLPKTMEVSLKIYAVDGREISTVIYNKTLNPGEHSVSFNADDLPTGMYYYSLQNEEAVLTKRMIVVE